MDSIQTNKYAESLQADRLFIFVELKKTGLKRACSGQLYFTNKISKLLDIFPHNSNTRWIYIYYRKLLQKDGIFSVEFSDGLFITLNIPTSFIEVNPPKRTRLGFNSPFKSHSALRPNRRGVSPLML